MTCGVCRAHRQAADATYNYRFTYFLSDRGPTSAPSTLPRASSVTPSAALVLRVSSTGSGMKCHTVPTTRVASCALPPRQLSGARGRRVTLVAQAKSQRPLLRRESAALAPLRRARTRPEGHGHGLRSDRGVGRDRATKSRCPIPHNEQRPGQDPQFSAPVTKANSPEPHRVRLARHPVQAATGVGRFEHAHVAHAASGA